MVQQAPSEGKAHRGRLSGGAIATLIGLALLVIFIVQNTAKVRLHFLVWHFTWALWLLSLISALVGALVWFGVGAMRRYRQGRR